MIIHEKERAKILQKINRIDLKDARQRLEGGSLMDPQATAPPRHGRTRQKERAPTPSCGAIEMRPLSSTRRLSSLSLTAHGRKAVVIVEHTSNYSNFCVSLQGFCRPWRKNLGKKFFFMKDFNFFDTHISESVV